MYTISIKNIAVFFLFSVDATNDAKTRVGRMINDSESNYANAKMMVVQVERKPHLCLFAQKDIEENEEIRFDYGVADLPWRQMVSGLFQLCCIL